jgi:hypothetical protein
MTEHKAKKNRCRTCSCSKASKAIREFARLKEEGKTSLSWRMLYGFLATKHGYRFTYDALMKHVRQCLTAIKGRYGNGSADA